MITHFIWVEEMLC